jgi:hypothetical protein
VKRWFIKRFLPNHWSWCFIKTQIAGPCHVCGGRTRYIEVNFECWLHPGDCEDALVYLWRHSE